MSITFITKAETEVVHLFFTDLLIITGKKNNINPAIENANPKAKTPRNSQLTTTGKIFGNFSNIGIIIKPNPRIAKSNPINNLLNNASNPNTKNHCPKIIKPIVGLLSK